MKPDYLNYYKKVYEAIELGFGVCIDCTYCRPEIKSKCNNSARALCWSWLKEELGVKYILYYLLKLPPEGKTWFEEIVRRASQRLVGFAIAEMCLEGSK